MHHRLSKSNGPTRESQEMGLKQTNNFGGQPRRSPYNDQGPSKQSEQREVRQEQTSQRYGGQSISPQDQREVHPGQPPQRYYQRLRFPPEKATPVGSHQSKTSQESTTHRTQQQSKERQRYYQCSVDTGRKERKHEDRAFYRSNSQKVNDEYQPQQGQTTVIPKNTQSDTQIPYHQPEYHPEIIMMVTKDAESHIESQNIDIEEVSERVEAWFRDEYDAYPKGIEGFSWTDGGMSIILTESLEIPVFVEAMREEGYEVEIAERTGQVSVYDVESVGKQGEYKHKVGISYEKSETIPLGGSFEPIWEGMNFEGGVIEDTFHHIKSYLKKKYK